MNKKGGNQMKYRFWMILLLTSAVSVDTSAGLFFSSPKRPQPQMIQTQTYLSENNSDISIIKSFIKINFNN